jgi:hypothetical protein
LVWASQGATPASVGQDLPVQRGRVCQSASPASHPRTRPCIHAGALFIPRPFRVRLRQSSVHPCHSARGVDHGSPSTCRPTGAGRPADRRGAARSRLLQPTSPTCKQPDAARSLRHQRATAARLFNSNFNEAHILAITQAICEYRRLAQGIGGPLFLGMPTPTPLSEPAQRTAAGGARRPRRRRGASSPRPSTAAITPTPVISRAILTHNQRPHQSGWPGRRRRDHAFAQPARATAASSTIPPSGGPADTAVTSWTIQDRANELLRDASGLKEVLRIPYEAGAGRPTPRHSRSTMIRRLRGRPGRGDRHARPSAAAGLKHRRGPAWAARAYGLLGPHRRALRARSCTVVNTAHRSRPSAFMTLDHDGKIRMDCSSALRHGRPGRASRISFDVAFGNDPDADRHGIVTPAASG